MPPEVQAMNKTSEKSIKYSEVFAIDFKVSPSAAIYSPAASVWWHLYTEHRANPLKLG